MKFAQILSKIMKEKNISAYKMAKDTGLSDSLIGYWKNGLKKPSLDNILILVDYLGVSADYLLTGKEPDSRRISDDEKNLLDLFSGLDPKRQYKVLGWLEALAKEEDH